MTDDLRDPARVLASTIAAGQDAMQRIAFHPPIEPAPGRYVAQKA
jgi:hypothetical protein